MTFFEKFLIRLDSAPWGITSRMALGCSIPPVFRAVLGGRDQIWVSLALFVGLLVALRLIPAILRLFLPFSRQAKEIWFQRRQIAKLHDSYQWQKLLWVGLGVLAYAVVSGGLRNGEWAVTLVCLIGGAAGLLTWRRNKATVEVV